MHISCWGFSELDGHDSIHPGGKKKLKPATRHSPRLIITMLKVKCPEAEILIDLL